MEFPELPTDNLYKFITLFGLALIVAGIFLPWREERFYAQAHREMFDSTMQILSQTASGIFSDAADTEAEKKKDGRQYLGTFIDNTRKMLEKSIDLLAAEKTVARYQQIGNALVWAGCGISLLGFTLWYFWHQRYQDMMLRKQALSHGKERSG